MNDLISREQAISWIECWLGLHKYYHPYSKCKTIPTSEVLDILKRVPSAEKTGKWLMTEGYPHKVYCSECYATLIPNVEWFKTYNIASNYCPNCGSQMGEVNDKR